ncbi:MAG: hypothetical protein IT380_06820 [Myxococcales bacterium]|nr:hypothetical protein [Myxococcales bacterium]
MKRLVPLAFAALLVSACGGTPPATTPCAKDSECSGGRCLESTCYAKACANQTCGAVEVCVADACVDERCVTVTCAAGSVCAKGTCYETACGGSQCPEGQVCATGTCVESACAGVNCPTGLACKGGLCADACLGVTCGAGLTCQSGACVDACTGITCDAGKTCQAGVCIDTTCVGVTCASGTVCSQGTCLEEACVGVTCSGADQVCRAGSCVDRCTVECGGACPVCTSGRACTMDAQCESRLCESRVCTACDTLHACPNGGTCMNGICRQGVGGPCAQATDCNLGLTCEDQVCRIPAGQPCTGPNQCVKAVLCENLVCQRPRCQLQLLESQTVPNYVTSWNAFASGFDSATGEVYVSHGQWDNSYANRNLRRFRVAPGMMPVEQQPTVPPLIQLPSNNPTPQGFSDQAASVGNSGLSGTGNFWWVAGGGPWDGQVAVRIQFVNFNNDIGANFSNGGRFAKCGRDFYFFANYFGGTRAMLRFTSPVDVNSAAQSMLVDLTASTARRDTWAFATMFDLECAPDSLWVLGGAGGQVQLQKLDRNTLAAMGAVLPLPGISDGNGSIGDDDLTRVDDDLFYVVDQGRYVWQVYKGRLERLTQLSSGPEDVFGTRDGLVTYGGGVVRRYEKRMLDGTVPPLDTECVWQ